MLRQAIATRAERLRATPWMTVFGHAWALMFGCACLLWVLPRPLAHLLHPLFKLAPLLLLMAKDLSHLPDALARTRTAHAQRTWGTMLAAWLPPELVGLLRLGRDQRRGFVNWLLRRPQAALPPGQSFSYLERGSYRTAFAIVLFATLFEMPLDAAILPFFIKKVDERNLIHTLMLVGAISTLVWVLGDRWLVGAGRHVLDAQGLQLHIGARTRGTIPRAAIVACEPLKTSAADWCRRHGVAAGRTLLASPLDKPNTVLVLDGDSPVRLDHLGRERTGLCCVFLYLDQPQALAAALGHAAARA